jgi:transposase-like protein
MPETPVRLRVPTTCPRCGAKGVIVLETSISREGIVLEWWCRQCEHAWPVKRGDELAPKAS